MASNNGMKEWRNGRINAKTKQNKGFFFFRELKVKKMVIDWGKWDNRVIKNGLEKF